MLAMLALGQLALAQSTVQITLKQGTSAEVQTREQLQRLLKTYDLSPWIYTTSIVIDEQAIPFSHPVLTLHTRHTKDDDLLVSTFLHEQLHWFVAARQEAADRAIADLRRSFPNAPAGGTVGGRDQNSTYLHLIVCYLEQHADRRVFGELKTKQIMDFWASDHYTWVYQKVIAQSSEIGEIVRSRGLEPTR